MDWWSTGLNAGCPVVGQTGAGSNGQYGSLGLDSSSQQLDMGQQHQLAQQQQQQQHQCQQPSDFDHWLACDDLELGAIIQQVSSGAISSPGSDASAGHMQTPLVGGGGGGLITEDPKCAFNSVSNGPSSPTSTTSASLQAAPLTSDNKRHIMSIINNTLPPSYNSDAAELNQQQVIVSASSSSTAASPLSSSLGSSPLNSLSSLFSVQSPNSPANNNSNYHSSLIGDSLKTASLSNQRRPQHEQQQLFLPHASQSYRRHQDECFGSLDYRARLQQQQSQQQQSQQSQQQQQQQQQQQSFGEQQLDRIIISTGPAPASRVSSTQAGTRTQVGGRLHGQASKASQSPQEPTTTTTIITTTTTSSCTGAGSSLLTSDCARPTQAKGPGKQTRKTATTATRGASATSTSGQGLGQKLRRCRTITDYVLAEEEKRLLIKEGHTDFPMICESRPLTKIEERILRKIRRKIRNKKSAQCSRQRKKEYVEELERKYAVILRENGELKQMLARVQQQQQPASHQNREQAGGDHLQPYGDTCNETQTSCSADAPDLIWKDLFQPQSVSARLAAAAAQQQQYHEPAGGATYN